MLKTWKDKKYFKTNKSRPKQIQAPKVKIIYVADVLKNQVETPIMVAKKWMFTKHDPKKVIYSKP